MSTRARLRCLVACGVLAGAGCRDATAPAPSVAGTYTLRAIGGHALPVGLVLADTLELRADGTVRRTRVDSTTSLNDPTRWVPFSFVVAGTWTARGDSVVVRLTTGTAGGAGARGQAAAGALTFVGPGDLWPAVAGATVVEYRR